MFLKTLRIISSLAIGVLWTQALLAQPIFQHITSEDGLSENVVNTIFQDDVGFMWFGTNDGLNKYDGYEFSVYTPEPNGNQKISSNLIYAITSDNLGNLWVGTTGAGLNKFDPRTEKFSSFKHDPRDPKSIPNDQIVSLYTDSRGWIWMATRTGITVFDPELDSPVFENFGSPLVSGNLAVSLFREDKKGNVYIATNSGILKVVDVDLIQDIHFEPLSFPISTGVIRGMAFDHYDNLIFTSTAGIIYVNDMNNYSQIVNLGSFNQVNDVVVDKNNEIWVGSYEGIIHFERSSRTQSPYLDQVYEHSIENKNSLNKNLVISLFQDSNGVIWAGINGGGVNKFDPDRKPFRHVSKLKKSDGGNEKIRAVLEDSYGGLWIGTEGDGLFYRASKEKEFRRINSASSTFSLAEVTKDQRRWIYVGAEGTPTLQKIEITGNVVTEPEELWDSNASVFAILQDDRGQLWIGTYNNGLSRFSINKDYEIFDEKTFRHDINDENSLSNDIIRKLVQDNKGNIWIGTGEGLSMIPSDQVLADQIQFRTFKNEPDNENSISYNYILDIIESKTAEIWVGTFGGGLNKVVRRQDDTYVFESFDQENGLPNGTVKSILEDQKGHVWVSTNKGLSVLNPRSESFKNYSTKDGLQSNEFLEVAAARLKNGDFLFGGVNGYNVFDPQEIHTSTLAPEIVFTELKVLNKKVLPGEETNGRVITESAIGYGEELELKYDENYFSLSFAALDYTSSDQIMYSYILEGFDEKWTETSSKNRHATYTNLPAGSYVLKVRSTNSDGVWNNDSLDLKISIKPPFWLTWYAYVFYALAAFVLLWFLRQYELIGIKEKHRLMVDDLERQKRDEIQDLKLNFFTNISHELRTPLTLIIAPLENLMKSGKSMSFESVSQQYHLIFKNAKYLLRLVDQLLDFRKLDQGKLDLEVRLGDIVRFVKEATEPFQFLASKQEIDFKITSEAAKAYFLFDPEVVEKVLYNLLSNAFKFTPNGGFINVHISEVEMAIASSKNEGLSHYMKIEIRDSGIGISSKLVKRIFERFYKVEGDKFTKDGAGIGLSFTKSLVNRHYGEIEVESKKGEGSVFIVKLPMKKSTYRKSEIVSGKIRAAQFTTDPLEYFSPERPAVLPVINEGTTSEVAEQRGLPLLLFVDDNSDIRKFIRSGFEDDFRIIDAENGVKGLELAKSSKPDIIISDIMMPEMDGIELCNLLKEDVETSHIPIVLLTAKTNIESEIEGLETGADSYVKKPFKLEVLRQQIVNIHKQREKLKSRFRQQIILEPSEITVTSADEEFLKRAMGLIEDHMSDAEFNVEALVKEMFISRSKLYLKIKALTGQSTSEFIRTIRLKRAVQLLEKSDYTIKEIMFMTGFNTASYFSKCFKKQYGIVPSEYMNSKQAATTVE